MVRAAEVACLAERRTSWRCVHSCDLGRKPVCCQLEMPSHASRWHQMSPCNRLVDTRSNHGAVLGTRKNLQSSMARDDLANSRTHHLLSAVVGVALGLVAVINDEVLCVLVDVVLGLSTVMSGDVVCSHMDGG